MLKRKAVVLLVVLAAIAITIPAVAYSSSYVKIYEDTDWLNGPGDYWDYSGTFSRGRTYAFQLIVPGNADFDIKIYDENGHLVVSGTNGRGETETVYLTPR
ncbi:MAG TPA: hypothetical protein ENH11_04105, partial [Candidatus Acetothermia bacterium]|nr:hypothetical protein [Candidatus Acetothermia bacterium]